MTTNSMFATEPWSPVAYITMQDPAARARIVGALQRIGWVTILPPTGFHLIQSIAGVIDGHHAWQRPGLIVIDARSRGCAGTTIAAGLRDLGITIPIVLIAAAGEPLPVSPDDLLRVVESADAESAVTGFAARLSVASGHTAPPESSLSCAS